jgi:hypothetical protein
MRVSKNLEELGSIPTAKIIQEIQPNKICTCGACELKKPKRTDGKRQLKVSSQLVVHQRAWVKEESVYDLCHKFDWLANGCGAQVLKLANALLFQRRKGN